MIQNANKLTRFALTLILLLAGSDAFAGSSGFIDYSPYQSIPALSDAMLVVLSLLFAIIAFRVLRNHSVGKPLASLVAAGVLTLAAASGNQLISSAQATIAALYFSSSSGGSVDVLNNGLFPVQNTSGRPQQITNVRPVNCSRQIVSTAPYSPQCVRGLVVQNNDTCYVDFESQSCS